MIEYDLETKLYVTTQHIEYKDVIVPKGFVFDGVTVKAGFSALFSQKELRIGKRASCIHDYMCQNKNLYTVKQSTDYLVDIWVEDGLDLWKAWFVYKSVYLYQTLAGGWKK